MYNLSLYMHDFDIIKSSKGCWIDFYFVFYQVSMDYTKRVLPQLPIANGRDREYTALIPTEDNPSDSAFLSDLSGEGIYDVPRSVIAPYGGKILINGMRDIYDHPRGKFINIRDDEGVYISPNEDDEDEDIYAYPPDALDDHMLLTQEEALQSLGVYGMSG